MPEFAVVTTTGLPHAGVVGAFFFWAIFVTWVGGEVWLQQHRALPTHAIKQDFGSMPLIVAAVWSGVVLGLASSFALPGLAVGGALEPLFALGVGLMVSGLALRWWAVVSLRSAFTVTVGVPAQEELIVAGPYRLVRHPSYTGSLLTVIGIAMCFANWLSLVALLLPFGAYAYRIQVEEQALLARYGDSYRSYRRTTKRLLPWLI